MDKAKREKINLAVEVFRQSGREPFPFQMESWEAVLEGFSGILNAPTGSGKTLALMIPILLMHKSIAKIPEKSSAKVRGVKAIWITPIRALAREIELAAGRAATDLGINWTIGVRTGDTTTGERSKQSKNPPDLLITTPESLQLLIASKNHESYFSNLSILVADEWHELMGTKRGVQMELALSRIRCIKPDLRLWGISATISNMEEAMSVLLGVDNLIKSKIIRADIKKNIEVISVLPDEVEKLPWAGHLGIRILEKIIPIIEASTGTLIFTNTRSFAEIWYRQLLEKVPELSGRIAMHHGSISRELRSWVEDRLHEGKLKAVICTASLDLGVDFRPVETVIQVGSPKGIARFLQRAGRSGHQPGAISRIYFLPTHSLELTEAAALRDGINAGIVEERIPYIRSFDVLIQYLMTLAVGDGFIPAEIYREVVSTWSYRSVTQEEWNWLIRFITVGSQSLEAYDEYRKAEFIDGRITVTGRAIARRHRLSIGTIVGDSSLLVKYVTGKKLGSIEEYFISSLSPGDVFWFAGRSLELVRVRGMEAHVRNSKKKSGKVPSWQGGRMPLSSPMGEMMRKKINESAQGTESDPEMKFIRPLLERQKKLSHLPFLNEFLIECMESTEGWHLLMYPFEGRFVHEGLAALIAHRISEIKPISFSIAMNDYGFELLSDRRPPVEEALEEDLFRETDLLKDIQAGINSTEMARRKFRDIAAIAGLVFKGFPGAPVKDRHLQSSSQLFFDVFRQYEPDNLLLQQSFEEVMDFQLEEARMRNALQRIAGQKIVLTYPERPTPFSFPIMVDRLREKLSTEQIQDRISKMSLEYEDE